jgi:hypothetical protein
MQPLFLESTLEFEKTSAQTQLPEDPNAWPHEILQEVYKQAPYVADFAPHVVMEKVEGEQGYGLGYVEIGNQTEIQTSASPTAAAAAGLRQVRVPIVIKDGMLAPFDLLVTSDSKVLPLTENRLRTAIFRPQSFDVTSRTPGDQSMIGQLYPPYRQSMGFGGSGVSMNVGMGKEGSALERFLTKTAAEHCGSCDPNDCSCECGKCKLACAEKTASFESEVAPYLEKDYLHAEPGSIKQARHGKKMEVGDYQPGMLQNFIEKNAAATGLPSVAKTVAKNTSSAKHLATRAGVRASNILKKMKKTGSVLEAILPTIYESDLLAFKRAIVDPDLQPLLYKNAASITPSIQLLLEAPERPKFASHFGALVKPSVVQLRRTDEGYRAKTASHLFWEPLVETLDRGEAVRRFGEKMVLAADLSGAATLSEENPESPHIGDEGAGSEHDSETEAPKPVTEAGLYKVKTPEGAESVGYVIPNLIDVDGTALPLALFTNGTQAVVQGDVVGVPVEGDHIDLPTSDTPSGRGVFASEDAGEVKATVPLNIQGSAAGMGEGEPTMYRAESFTGQEVMVSLQPNLQEVVPSDGKLLIPEHWRWVPLGQAEAIAVESQEDGLGKAASVHEAFPFVDVVSAGGETFSFRGPVVEKLAHDEREQLGLDDAMFLLAGLGVNQDYGVQKLAMSMTGEAPVRVRVGRTLKFASDERAEARARAADILSSMPVLRHQLFKEAATIGDPTAVDTVLSLGFLNPENITTFIGYLPVLEASQAKLCDVLLASRLGNLLDTPEGSIERAVRSLEAVLEGLKSLAFQSN